MVRRWPVAVLVTAASLLAACSSTQASGRVTTTTERVQRPAATGSPGVTLAASQPAGSSVKVDRVDLPRPATTGGTGGIVAVCADTGGGPGTCDGYASIPNGTTQDVVIHTPTPLVAGPYIVGVYAAHGLPSGDQQPLATAKVQLT